MGKSTLASKAADRRIVSTDDFRDVTWSDVPHRIIAEVDALDSFVVEGVMVPRALRKGMEVDAVVYLTRPKVRERKPGQAAMAKGVWTVFQEWQSTNPLVPVFIESSKHESLPSLPARRDEWRGDVSSLRREFLGP